MDQVLRRASRVVVDASGKGVASVVPYLPLGDQTWHNPADAAPLSTPATPAPSAGSP
jgi:membrane protease subunit HflK